MSAHIYSDTWAEFVKKVSRYSGRQRTTMLAEAAIDPSLDMIVKLAADWRATYSARDAADRVRQAQARLIEERRMAIDSAQLRDYVADDTRALMPPIKARRRPSADRWRAAALAADFWAGMERGRWRGRDLDAIVARCREPHRLRLLTIPYGPPVTADELNTLRDTFRSMRPRPVRAQINPAGMTPERALAIALAVQPR